MFANAVVRRASEKQAIVTLAVDRDVLDWFQAQGDSAERQMAIALKIYAEANQAYLTDRNTNRSACSQGNNWV